MKGWFRGWPLDKKIYFVLASLIYAISLILLIVCSSFYISGYIDQSTAVARDQLSSLALNYASTLDSYKDLAESLTIDDTIQAYLKCDGPLDPRYYERVSAVKSTLQNAQNLYSDLMFVAVVSYRFDGVAYKGTLSKISSNFLSVYPEDYRQASFRRDTGTLRMSYNDAYLKGESLLNVYFPVYSISKMINENGLLCMVLDSSLFDELSQGGLALSGGADLIVTDANGLVVAASSKELIGTKISGGDSFQTGSHLFIQKKVGKWNYRLVSRIPLVGMYKGGLAMLLMMSVICVLVAALGQILCRRIIRVAYRPLNDVIDVMNQAAAGRLDARVGPEHMGADFAKLAAHFNHMMERINELVAQAKRDQTTADQLRFNALQSQIQPHFLYNTLDCIHWQASADGNQEMSDFVRALAQYYRLCLSKGRDVIALEQELLHVENYLFIQNIRYDHIVEGEIDCEPDCKKVRIPKITLQPLVENSIYHGIKIKEGCRGRLFIRAFRQGNDVLIELRDNGTGMSSDEIERINQAISASESDFGYGVRNVNRRIELLFGRGYGLHYSANEDGGVTVTVRLPFAPELSE
jgi:two-component system sensor histidine kinase YesM